MAEAAISAVVQLLGDVLIQKVNSIRGVEGEIQLLKDELNRMRSFLRDANKKQAQDDRVRNWISDIKEVALDTEDAIEAFVLNIENVRKGRGLLERCVCFPSHLRRLDRVGEEIESIRARLVDIDRSRERYGIKDLGELGESSLRLEVEARRRLSPWDKDEHLVGMEGDVKKLLEQIIDEEKKGLSVAAVAGMGGIGKSTLAREVYNHPDVVSGDRFDCRGWVVVSSEFTPQETVKQLILETTPSEEVKQQLREEINKLEVESSKDKLYLERKLKELLHKRLEGKTYFIVLDDVWEKEHLDSLMTAFPKEQDKTSKLLLTTRNSIITNHYQSLHEMKLLNSEKSWELFLKKSLTDNSNEEFPNKLEQIGRDIVDKCEGLPLSITLIGGLLNQARSDREREDVLNKLNSHFGREESGVSKILEAVLKLSYQNLSSELKSCFLCLAFFKEDATIPVKRLLHIIGGQGLITHDGRTTAEEEEIARGYLDELINRSLVQVKDLTLDNRVKSFHLHDSLRNICLKKAKEEIGLEILKGNHEASLHKPRHCVLQFRDLGSFSMNQKKHIRSLFLLSVRKDFKSGYWEGFQHLKILVLDCDYYFKELPNSFRLLLGLKELRIRAEHNCPIWLPTWLDTLKKLEVLDMGALYVAFPDVALEMDSLRHVHANTIYLPIITDGWKNVETLKYLSQEDWMRFSSRVTDDFRLQELGILVDRETESVLAGLCLPRNLVKLHLLWQFRLRKLQNFFPPNITLTKLKLGGLINHCPRASMLPPNLSHLTLKWSYLDKDPMQELGQLPKLSYLKLKDHSYTGESMRILHDGFPSLRGLTLRSLVQLRSVVIEEGGMPQLELLQIDRCRLLDTKNLWNKSFQLQILANTV